MARLIGETPGIETPVPVERVQKQRRDYTARQLREMADRAAEGYPPPGSPAEYEIRRAELGGDFERANALRREVKEKSAALGRLARAAEKAERRTKARHEHAHRCMDYPNPCNGGKGDPGPGDGPCRCKCGAVQVFGHRVVAGVRGDVWWRSPNGALVRWPDPREKPHGESNG